MNKVTKFEKKNLETLGERIRAERTKMGLSQENLADTLSIKRQMLNYYETDTRKPDIDMLIKISEELNVSIDYLLGKTLSKEISNTEISRKTGLSDESIEKLSKFCVKDSWQIDALYGESANYMDYSKIINQIIKDEKFEPLIYFIRAYINSNTKEKLEKEITRLTSDIDENSIDLETIGFNPSILECSTTDVFKYKISEIFTSIVNSIFDSLQESTSKRWCLDKKSMSIKRVCKDGSEKKSMLKGRGVTGGSTRNNKKQKV